jgi:hypothetical protein
MPRFQMQKIIDQCGPNTLVRQCSERPWWSTSTWQETMQELLCNPDNPTWTPEALQLLAPYRCWGEIIAPTHDVTLCVRYIKSMPQRILNLFYAICFEHHPDTVPPPTIATVIQELAYTDVRNIRVFLVMVMFNIPFGLTRSDKKPYLRPIPGSKEKVAEIAAYKIPWVPQQNWSFRQALQDIFGGWNVPSKDGNSVLERVTRPYRG